MTKLEKASKDKVGRKGNVSLNKTEFTRKDYMDVFKDISSATASRDLKKGAEIGLFEKIGEKNKTMYRLK